MKPGLPTWALKPATHQDRERAEQANRQGYLQIRWPESRKLKSWAKHYHWPISLFNFEADFIRKMLENDENFALALNESGIEILIPIQHYSISDEKLRDFDILYENRSPNGRPTDWGPLVEELREIRRAVEANIVIEIDGQTFKQFGSFYNWVYARYHMLEDGYDKWVGDDS